MENCIIHNSQEEAIEQFRIQNPGCKITEFTGNPLELIDCFDLKEYPIPLDNSTPKYLIKIGIEKYMLLLWKQGIVYMNPLSYFKNIEVKEDLRGDPNEGIYCNVQTGGLIIGPAELKLQTSLAISASNINNGYVYCLIGVDNDDELKSVLEANLATMGGSCVIITNPKEFIKRCATVMRSNNIDLKWGRVRYYDKAKGSYLVDPWLKEKKYAKQSEFRLYFQREEKGSVAIILGSIEDIAEAFYLQHD